MTNPGAARVLVIDDDSQIRALTVEMLEAEGYRVDSAADGTAGLGIAYRESPDLILCDVQMGGVDGYEVLTALRRDPRTAIIPVIFFTGVGGDTAVRHGMNLGADDYLVKPISTELLFQEPKVERSPAGPGRGAGRERSKVLGAPLHPDDPWRSRRRGLRAERGRPGAGHHGRKDGGLAARAIPAPTSRAGGPGARAHHRPPGGGHVWRGVGLRNGGRTWDDCTRSGPQSEHARRLHLVFDNDLSCRRVAADQEAHAFLPIAGRSRTIHLGGTRTAAFADARIPRAG